jgi:hypothetical protein
VKGVVAAVRDAAITANLILCPYGGQWTVDVNDGVADRLVERRLIGAGHDVDELRASEAEDARAAAWGGTQQRHARECVDVRLHDRRVLRAQSDEEALDRCQHRIACRIRGWSLCSGARRTKEQKKREAKRVHDGARMSSDGGVVNASKKRRSACQEQVWKR